LLVSICQLSQQIEELTRELRELARSDELVLRLQSVPGVGPVVGLAFVAWMDRPERFQDSRDVGACLGIRPKVRGSGGVIRHGNITREGDKEMRALLVQAAHAALHSSKDAALLRWAKNLVERIGKHKAVVALARKIAVLLHRLWVTGDSFRPFPQAA
jgi:transposase